MTSTTWVQLDEAGHYGPNNLPYGVFSTDDGQTRVGVRIGNFVLDAASVNTPNRPAAAATLDSETLNEFLEAGPSAWAAVRTWLTNLLTDSTHQEAVTPHLLPLGDVIMLMPFAPGDYVDFYSSEHHATNLGKMFRPDSAALMPNWKHMPIGYHGRSGTIVPSGTPIVRPSGQRKAPTDDVPSFGDCKRLDIEAEMGFVVGTPTDLGDQVSVAEFSDYVFGITLVNDWSARDIQAWEYVPLGPFLGKSFATSISPWITPMAALEAARIQPPARTHDLLPYLVDDANDPWGLDITLEVDWNGTTVAKPPFGTMYWTPAQQLAHMTVNGASVRSGDLYASGTISGPEKDQRGSFIELSWGGKETIELADGATRTFLEDGDTVTLRATLPGVGGGTIALGDVTGTIEPANYNK